MLTWTDSSAKTPEQQIIFAQLEIMRRLEPGRVITTRAPQLRSN